MLESAELRNAPLVDTHETTQNPASVPSHVPTAGTQSRVELSGVVTSLCSSQGTRSEMDHTGRCKANCHSRMQSC